MNNESFILFYLGYLFEVPTLFQEVNWYNLVFVLFFFFFWMKLLSPVLFYSTVVWDILCFRNGAMSWVLRDKNDVPGTQRLVEENSALW